MENQCLKVKGGTLVGLYIQHLPERVAKGSRYKVGSGGRLVFAGRLACGCKHPKAFEGASTSVRVLEAS